MVIANAQPQTTHKSESVPVHCRCTAEATLLIEDGNFSGTLPANIHLTLSHSKGYGGRGWEETRG